MVRAPATRLRPLRRWYRFGQAVLKIRYRRAVPDTSTWRLLARPPPPRSTRPRPVLWRMRGAGAPGRLGAVHRGGRRSASAVRLRATREPGVKGATTPVPSLAGSNAHPGAALPPGSAGRRGVRTLEWPAEPAAVPGRYGAIITAGRFVLGGSTTPRLRAPTAFADETGSRGIAHLRRRWSGWWRWPSVGASAPGSLRQR